MLPDFIIKEILQRERREKHQELVLELEIPMHIYKPSSIEKEIPERGVVILEL